MYSIINSDDKTTGTNGNCVINLNSRIQGEYALYSFFFTNTLYNVNDTNNRLVLANASGSVISNNLITAGYYTGAELASQITNQIASLSATYDENTGKFTFTYSADFQFLFANYTNTSYLLLGFENDTDYTSASSSLTSANPSDLILHKNLYITIKEANKPFSKNSSTSHRDYSLKVYDSNTSFGGLFRYEESDLVKQQNFELDPTRRIKIKIYDDNDHIVDLSNWTMILQRK
jgi:hypothetical protein